MGYFFYYVHNINLHMYFVSNISKYGCGNICMFEGFSKELERI